MTEKASRKGCFLFALLTEQIFEKGDNIMTAYKLLRELSDGNLYPLFINKTNPTPIGEWMQAECIPTKGFAVRQGWHCCFTPYAPHLKEQLANGERRVWVECEVEDIETYNRPESQGGKWILAQRMKIVRKLNDGEAERLRVA